MFRNYLIIAWRNFRRQKIFSFINLLGLAVGMASCMLIFSYVGFERSYDRHFEQASSIYKVLSKNGIDNSLYSRTYPGIAPGIERDFQEIVAATHIFPVEATVVYHSPTTKLSFKEERIAYADSSLQTVFQLPLIRSSALTDPFSMIISSSIAQKYFGNSKAVGKTLTVYDDFGKVTYEVKDVFSDLPENSHGKFDMLLSQHHIEGEIFEKRQLAGWRAFYTYIKVHPHAEVEELEQKISSNISNYIYSDQEEEEGVSLQPLTDIYLNSEHISGNGEIDTGNSTLIYLLMVLAIFIMVLAWTNYVNLATARSLERAREVGIRKVLGSVRSQIIWQFLAEALLLNLLAGIVAFTFTQLGLPWLEQVTSKPLASHGYWGLTPYWWSWLFTLLISGTFLSGWYPSLVLSSFNPTDVLRGNFSRASKGAKLRRLLVIFQFSIATVLITGTLAVYFQLNYMLNKDTGIDLKQKLIVEGPSIMETEEQRNKQVIVNEWKTIAGIKEILSSGSIPGVNFQYSTNFQPENSQGEEGISLNISYIQNGFFRHFNIPILYGRAFFEDISKDNRSVIINKAAAHKLGWEVGPDMIGKQVSGGNNEAPWTLIGIAQNYHHNSLQYQYEPTVYIHASNSNYFSILIEAEEAELPEIRRAIEESFQSIYPSSPFISFFLDDAFERKYQSDRLIVNLLTVFSCLALFLAVLGVFGLAAYNTSQRIKEISIRKILGARFPDLLILLGKDFLWLILISSIIGIPVAAYGTWEWLSNYAFHISLSVGIFVIPFLIVFCIGFLTITALIFRSVRLNPADILRHE